MTQREQYVEELRARSTPDDPTGCIGKIRELRRRNQKLIDYYEEEEEVLVHAAYVDHADQMENVQMMTTIGCVAVGVIFMVVCGMFL